jgi:hypothetical protein
MFVACGPPDEINTNSPPTIYNLVYQPNTITTNTDFTIFCSVDYEDKNADVKSMDFIAHFPDNTDYEGEEIELEEEYGVEKGTSHFQIYIHVTLAGLYLVDIWLIDEKRNESNRLVANFTVHD